MLDSDLTTTNHIVYFVKIFGVKNTPWAPKQGTGDLYGEIMWLLTSKNDGK